MRLILTRRYIIAVLILGVSFGCAEEDVIETGPPEDWIGEDNQWWRGGVDTMLAFRDLETLSTMNVSGAEVTYVASTTMASRREILEKQFVRAVKRSLLRLYRNQPEVVDSLFERHVAPTLQQADLSGNLQAEVERFKKKSYRLLHRSFFQEPQVAKQLGRDIEVPYPDSLRCRGDEVPATEEEDENVEPDCYAGTVWTQVYVNAEGMPEAVMVVESVHPLLDDIAMRTATQMEWRPAYLMGKGNWKAIDAWVRFGVRFKAGP